MPPNRLNGRPLRAKPPRARRGSVEIEITMPGPYFRRIVERSQARGVSKSEALRQFMDEAEGGGTKAQRDRGTEGAMLLPSEKQVMREVVGQIRILAIKQRSVLRLINQPCDHADEIEKLTERLLLAL